MSKPSNGEPISFHLTEKAVSTNYRPIVLRRPLKTQLKTVLFSSMHLNDLINNKKATKYTNKKRRRKRKEKEDQAVPFINLMTPSSLTLFSSFLLLPSHPFQPPFYSVSFCCRCCHRRRQRCNLPRARPPYIYSSFLLFLHFFFSSSLEPRVVIFTLGNGLSFSQSVSLSNTSCS